MELGSAFPEKTFRLSGVNKLSRLALPDRKWPSLWFTETVLILVRVGITLQKKSVLYLG